MTRYAAIVFMALAVVLSGCAAGSWSRSTAEGQGDEVLPPPTCFNIETTLEINVPEEIVGDSGVPNTAHGHFTLSIEAEAIQANPVRSQFAGDIALRVTDPNGQATYIDFATHLDGECDGDPSKGIWQAIVQTGGSLAVLFRQMGPMFNEGTS